MPGYICAVAVCQSNSEKGKKEGEKISFHSFPTNKALKKEWVRGCHRKDKFDVNHKKICGKHFTTDDYADEIQAKIMGVMPKKLKKNAVPSLNLLPSMLPGETLKPSQRMSRNQNKERVDLIQKILNESKSIPALELTCQAQINNIPGTSAESDFEKLKRSYDALLEENNEAKKQMETYQKEIAESNLRNANLQKENREIQNGLNTHVNEVLSTFLSKNQIEVLLKRKTRARWNEDEISKAFTLRYFGKRGYIYVRQKLNYPLPGISTLQRWASTLNLRNGILSDILRIMDTCGQTKTNIERLTVLSYDEVKVCDTYEYDQQKDEVVGEHKYMQVVMARGLIDPWKQPVYVDFDQKLTKAILDEILNQLHNINYNVIACVSDCGGGNMGLWKELEISIHKTYYIHPTAGEKIYFFADVPHLLKLIRNWLVDNGFLLKDGTIISKHPIEALIHCTNSEVSSCHKLSMHHITCEKAQRQNVSTAAQVFSNTTATALARYLPGDDKKKAKDAADFVELVATWFDIFNSYVPNASVPTKSPYGSARLEEQNAVLNKVKSTFITMRCCNKNALQIFQKGVYVSTTSLQSLYQDLTTKYGITYILTHRLNQDCLENFFSQIRTKGGLHDHPSPLNALYRIRLILLGKNPGLVQKHTNVPIVEDNEYLMTTAMKKAQIKCPNLPDTLIGNIVTDESCSDASMSSESSITFDSMAEKDGLVYVAGYLARKFKDKYPALGKFTYQTDQATTLHSYSMPSWVQHLSFGGLTDPSARWTEQVLKMEHQFKKYHPVTFSNKKNVVEKTALYISKRATDVPKDLVKAFARQRIFIRIKYLNDKKNEIALKRKREEETDHRSRKEAKKMKKTTN